MYINSNVCKQMTDVKLLLLHRNTWNNLTERAQKMFKNAIKKCVYELYIFNIYE